MTAATGIVCDDRRSVRRRLCAQLTHRGIDVLGEAQDFVDLLTLVLRTRPDLAVITLPLPGTSGLTAVHALRATAPGCELVLLSALGNLDWAAREAGAYAVVAEEDAQSLSRVLSSLVEERSAAELAATIAGSSTTKASS